MIDPLRLYLHAKCRKQGYFEVNVGRPYVGLLHACSALPPVGSKVGGYWLILLLFRGNQQRFNRTHTRCS